MRRYATAALAPSGEKCGAGEMSILTKRTYLTRRSIPYRHANAPLARTEPATLPPTYASGFGIAAQTPLDLGSAYIDIVAAFVYSLGEAKSSLWSR